LTGQQQLRAVISRVVIVPDVIASGGGKGSGSIGSGPVMMQPVMVLTWTDGIGGCGG